MNNLFEKLECFGLSTASKIDIKEMVDSYFNMHKLPPATKGSLQVICDLHNIGLSFAQNKQGNLMLYGIFSSLRATYLYPDSDKEAKESQKNLRKKVKELYLVPGGKERLFSEDEL